MNQIKKYNHIAVDFDGTLCRNEFPEIGSIEPINQSIINFIRKNKKCGSVIILWTCREDTEERKYLTEAIEWCRSNNIPIDYVNVSDPNLNLPIKFASRKVIADLYIDDKAINAFDIFYID